jgi:hypothetical protein
MIAMFLSMRCIKKQRLASHVERSRAWSGLAEILPLSYNVKDYARHGFLHKLLHVQDPNIPAPVTVAQIQKRLSMQLRIRVGPRDLSNRLRSEGTRDRESRARCSRTDGKTMDSCLGRAR